MKKCCILLLLSLYACGPRPEQFYATPSTASLISVFDSSLRHGILDAWYPRAIDTADGGYFSNMSFNWEISEYQPKMLVTQSRHIWTSSQAGIFYSDTTYLDIARHGFLFLKDHMWDRQYGGFFNIRSRDGGDLDKSYRDEKRAYGNSFAIYGLCSYYQLSKDTSALEYAKKTFLWLEKYSHDKINGGYVDAMGRDGTWLNDKNSRSLTNDVNHPVWKDYNSSIHLLESFTELYKIWPDPLVKKRLQEMLTLVRDTFVTTKGYLVLNFTEGWNPVSNRDSATEVILTKSFIDHVSFGHDIETAFLLLEASYALGYGNDTTTLRIAKKLVDHSLEYGSDKKTGGIFYEGYYFRGSDTISILNKEKSWWVQAETLNSLLLMSKIFPNEKKYYNEFLKQWEHIDKYLIDKEYGDWYINGIDNNPEAKTAPKSSIWKANYHNGRALMNCIRILKNENEVAEHFSKIKI
jgi:mannobiose 2-epimerase